MRFEQTWCWMEDQYVTRVVRDGVMEPCGCGECGDSDDLAIFD